MQCYCANVGVHGLYHDDHRAIIYTSSYTVCCSVVLVVASLYSLKPQYFDKPHRQWVFGVKNLVLKKYPKISTRVKLGILTECRPEIFALFKNPKILTSNSRTWVFWCQKPGFLWNTPRFWQVLNLRFRYDVSPMSFYALKIPRFWQVTQAMGFCAKNLVLKKYPKISISAKLKISMRYKPNIFVVFKSPKILTNKSRPLVFRRQKHGFYEILQAFKKCFTWNFDTL